MKIITFFSEKGGVGKTTLTAMFASYLAYHCREKVYAMDFDAPSFRLMTMRNKEMKMLDDPSNKNLIDLAAVAGKAYPVGRMQMIKPMFTASDLKMIVDQLRRQTEGKDGYFLLDFPGRFSPWDPVYHIAAAGLIDLIVVPTNIDRQSLDSVHLLAQAVHGEEFRRMSGGRVPDVAVVWNFETAGQRSEERRRCEMAETDPGQGAGRYVRLERELVSEGVDVLRTRVHFMPGMSLDADARGFLRCTLCYPQARVNHNAPHLNDLFKEIKDRVDGHIS